MIKVVLSLFIILILLTILTSLEIDKLSNPRADIILINNQDSEKQVSYRDFWIKNREDIKRKFNPYIDDFHPIGCLDQIVLRGKIEPTTEIRKLSDELTSDSLDDLDNVYKLHQYVYKNIEYNLINESLNAEEILDLKQGDCSEKSILLSSLLNSKKISNYVANTPKHRYLFVDIEGVWLPVDATTGDFYFILNAWDEPQFRDYYVNSEIFMFNQTHTVFARKWC